MTSGQRTLFVPAHRALEWNLLRAAADNPGSHIHPDPAIHIPMATFLNMVAPAAALGAAEHALEEFQEPDDGAHGQADGGEAPG